MKEFARSREMAIRGEQRALTRMADCREVNDRQSGVNAAQMARNHRRGFVLHL